jgi:hypothetical protein
MWPKGFAVNEIFFYWSSDGVISYTFHFCRLVIRHLPVFRADLNLFLNPRTRLRPRLLLASEGQPRNPNQSTQGIDMNTRLKMASLAALTAATLALPAAAQDMKDGAKCAPKASMSKCCAKCAGKCCVKDMKKGKCGAKKCAAKCAPKCAPKCMPKCAPKN